MDSESTSKPRRTSRLWPIALILVAFFAWMIARELSPARTIERASQTSGEAVSRVLEGWRKLTRPQIESRAMDFVNSLPVVEQSMALVVARMELTHTLYEENEKKVMGVNFGTTKASVTVPATVHYAIDLSGKQPVSFEISQTESRFTAVFPAPDVLAVEIVDKNQQIMVDAGWGRMKSRSGESLVEKLEGERYDTILQRAQESGLMKQARREARASLEKFVRNYLAPLSETPDEENEFDIEVLFLFFYLIFLDLIQLLLF